MKKIWTPEERANAIRTMVGMRSKWEYCIRHHLSRDDAAKMGVHYAQFEFVNDEAAQLR